MNPVYWTAATGMLAFVGWWAAFYIRSVMREAVSEIRLQIAGMEGRLSQVKGELEMLKEDLRQLSTDARDASAQVNRMEGEINGVVRMLRDSGIRRGTQ